MMITESLQLFGHDIYMSAKPTKTNLEIFLGFMERNNVESIVPLMPIQDIYQFYGYDLIEVYEDSNLNVIHYPIDDYDVPQDFKTFDYFLNEIGEALQQSSVLIHCSAGLGRTGLVTAALLIKYKEYGAKHAIDAVRKSRYGTVETLEQEMFLAKYDYYINGAQ